MEISNIVYRIPNKGKKIPHLIEEILYDPCRDKSLESYQDPTNQMIP